MDANTVEILTKARELISDESRWTRYVMAKNSNGFIREPTDLDAVCFCSLGAIQNAAGESYFSYLSARAALEESMGTVTVGLWNDAHSHADVLDAFSRAIAAAREA